MSLFSFDNTAGASQSSTNLLEGNKIHDVTFEEATMEDFQGRQDPNATYKVIKLKFKNEDGTFEHSIFEPIKDRGDFDRGVREFVKDGKQQSMPTPSNVEVMMLLIKHVIDAVRPDAGAKIDSGEVSLSAKSWDELRKIVTEILNKGKGAKTKIKLLTDNKGYGRFPGFFTGISRDGKCYVRDNFIGNKVGFSPYEISRIKAASVAKPTDMSSPSLDDAPTSDLSDINDFDLASL